LSVPARLVTSHAKRSAQNENRECRISQRCGDRSRHPGAPGVGLRIAAPPLSGVTVA
jgi:hypothetical protein